MRIYLIAVIMDKNDTDSVAKFRVIDLDSKEIKEVDKETLINAFEHNTLAFKNVTITKSIIKSIIRKHYITITNGYGVIPRIGATGIRESLEKYILASIDLINNTAELIDTEGNIQKIDLDDIYKYGRKIAGLTSRYDNDYRNLVQTAPTEDEIRLLKETNKLYESFLLLTKALGLDCSFKYSISGNAVILEKYTGSSTHAIVPKFVNVIDSRSFQDMGITTLYLNDGLKVIGVEAFSNNDIAEVDIPKTVTRICKHAFHNNKLTFKQIINASGVAELVHGDDFRIHNKNTVLSDQISN